MFPKSLMKRITGLLLTFSLVVALAPAPAARAASTIRVKATGTTAWPCGDTWASACLLQTALAQATNGDEIWVGKGVHKPTTSTTDRSATFQLVSGVAVYGGFALTETLRTQRDPTANVTVLSGDIDNNDGVDARGVVTTSANITGTNSYHVVKGATSATLDGVTITAGNASVGYPNNSGGGMYNNNSSPMLTNVTFSGNLATDNGGGLYNIGSSPTLTNVTFSGNKATYYGGGMENYYSSPTLTDVTFSGNSVTYSGGGMYNDNGSPTLSNVTFSGHSAFNGGGLYNYYSSPTLTNVTFSGNAAEWGGGMESYNSSPTLTNVTFSGNSALYGGGGMYNYRSNSPQMRNILLWGDTGGEIYNNASTQTISDSVVQGGCPSGITCTHVISTNPLLGPLSDYTCPDGQCQGGGSMQTIALLPGSSAIAGTSTNCPATDQRGVTRGSTCDIGAFESQGFTLGALTGTPQSATINTAFAQPLGLSVTSAFSEPVAGGVISFTAPASGASIAETTPFTKTISASGAVSATVTANGLTGSYTVTASASGATSVNFALTNTKQILYVRPAGATSGICESWATSCELRYALNLALFGPSQEIWVAAGIYTPTATTTDRSASFQFKSGVGVYGGFAMTETLRTQRDPAANIVVLSGDIDHNDGVDAQGVVTTSANIHGANSYHVVTGVDGATLDGVTITGGNAQPDYSNDSGGGMYNASSSPTLSNVTFSGNAATNGGGMYNNASSPALSNVTFSGNAANYGGGMLNEASSPTLTNVTFSGNTATIGGGGMFNWYYGNPMLTNVTFSGNSSTSGGGMYNITSSNPQMRNILLWGDSGGEIYNSSSTPTISDSVVQGGCPSGSICTRVISADPRLAPLGNYTCPGGQCQGGGDTPTFALLPDSPAIDAGNVASCPSSDQRGQARDDLRCDIGAYEVKYADSPTVIRSIDSANMTTFGPALMGLQRAAGFTDPGIITVTKEVWSRQGIESIGARWAITPTVTSGFSLTLQLCYTNAERNGLTESNLRFWRSDGITWTQVSGVPVLSTINGYRCAALSGITQLSRWTLATDIPTAITLNKLSARTSVDATSSLGLVLLLSMLVASGGAWFRQRTPRR